MNPVLVKLGGSLLTNKRRRESLRGKVLDRLASEIHSARHQKRLDLIVGHGGGSFPHFPAYKFSVHKGIKNKKSLYGYTLTNDAAARLNRHVITALIKARENAVSVQPSAWLTAKNGKIHQSFTTPFKLYLANGFLPVPYGDAVMDSDQGTAIISTEQLLAELASKLGAKKMIVVANIEGVFTDDPSENKNAEFIPEINKNNYSRIRKMLKGSYGTDVTGGMLHKVDELVELAKNGVSSQIISGEEKANLKNALLGNSKIGTTIKW